MRYAAYLARGWPIATGVVESACRHLVMGRCELSGMRRTRNGAEALLHLRCVHENGDWDAYHAFRRRQRHQRQRLYAVPSPDEAVTVLDLHALARAPMPRSPGEEPSTQMKHTHVIQTIIGTPKTLEG